MRIILLGPAGSGKGTQGELIERHYGFPRISTGDLLRQEVQKGTELGRKVAAIMTAGQLVADELVLEVVKEKIMQPDCRSGYVLDGYPRTLNQALLLEQIDNDRPEIALEIEISEDTGLSRLSARKVCPQCAAVYNDFNDKHIDENICKVCGAVLTVRDDDKPEVIRHRFRIYRETIGPLLDHYSRKRVLFRINGNQPVDKVFGEIKSVIEAHISGQQGEFNRQ